MKEIPFLALTTICNVSLLRAMICEPGHRGLVEEAINTDTIIDGIYVRSLVRGCS